MSAAESPVPQEPASQIRLLRALLVLPFSALFPAVNELWSRLFDALSPEAAGACAIAFGSLVVCLSRKSWRLRGAQYLLLFQGALALRVLSSFVLRGTWDVWNKELADGQLQAACLELGFAAGLWFAVGMFSCDCGTLAFVRRALQWVVCFEAAIAVIQFVAVQCFGVERAGTIPFTSALLVLQQSGVTYTNTIRLSGTLFDPNLFAAFVAMCWPALLPWGDEDSPPPGASRSSMLRRIGLLLLTGLAVFTLLGSLSRGAYFGLALQIGGLWAFRRKSSSNWCGTASVLVAAVGLSVLANPAIVLRSGSMADLADASLRNRLGAWGIAARMLLAQPLSGYGPGVFVSIYNHAHRLPGVTFPFWGLQSAVFSTLFEVGLLGGTFALLALVPGLASCLRRTQTQFIWLGLLGAAGSLMSSNVHCQPALVTALALLVSAALSASSCDSSRSGGMFVGLFYRPACVTVLGVLWMAEYAMSFHAVPK